MSGDLHACPNEVHRAIKGSDARWENETLPTPIYPGGPRHEKRQVAQDLDHWLEYANCSHCGSTIVRRVDVKLTQERL